MNSHWSFQPSPIALAIAIVVFGVMAFFSFRIWSRQQKRPAILGLECLRLFIAALVLFTLLRPERVVITPSEFEPEVAVLWDASNSMATPDVITDAANPIAITREAWVKSMVEGASLDGLKNAYHTTLIPFSSKADATHKETEGTDLSYALGEKLAGIHNLRAVLLMSDGDWNLGETPVNQAALLRTKGVPVYAVLTGSPTHLPDVEITETKVPSFCLAREKVSIPFKVANYLTSEVRTTATLSSQGVVQSTKDIVVPAGEKLQSSFVWTPPAVGKYVLTVGVPVQLGEVNPSNNTHSFTMDVRQETLRVLVIESVPRWEYRYLRNALARDPDVKVETLLLQPKLGAGSGAGYLDKFPEKEALGEYDVVFIGDIGIGEGELTKEQAQNIRNLVEAQGSGVVFLPGIRGRHVSWIGSPLDDLIPVEFDVTKPKGISSVAETRFQLTDLGSRHLLTMLSDTPQGNSLVWSKLPGFTWNAAIKKVRQGTELLAINPLETCESGRVPLLAIRPSVGAGTSLFMGIDSAWRWRKGVEDLYHYRFWGQVVRWMSHKRHLASGQGVRLFYSPETPVAGSLVRFNALLSDRVGFPVLKEEVKATLLDPEGKEVESFTMAENEGVSDAGAYAGSVKLMRGGIHTLKVIGAKSGISYDAKIEVVSATREVVGRPARPEPLNEIARLTKGASGGTADLQSLIAQIKGLPQAQDAEVREALWSRWWWGAILLSLLALYWVLRKSLGLI